jgi:hypothetical protein
MQEGVLGDGAGSFSFSCAAGFYFFLTSPDLRLTTFGVHVSLVYDSGPLLEIGAIRNIKRKAAELVSTREAHCAWIVVLDKIGGGMRPKVLLLGRIAQ